MITGTINRTLGRIEYWLVGPLQGSVRHNMWWETASAMCTGVFFAIFSFFPVVLRRLGAGADQIALFNVLSYVGISLAWLSLLIMRHISTRKFFLISLLLARGSIILVLFLPSIGGLLAFAAFYFIFLSLTGPAYNKIVQDVYPLHQRGKTMAVVRLGFALTLLLFSPIAGWLMDKIGYQYLFPLGALVGIGSVIALSMMRIPETDRLVQAASHQRSVWAILRKDRKLWLYLVILILFGLGALIPITLFPIIQVDTLKLTYSQIGLLALAQNLTWFLGFFISGRMVDRLGGLRTMQISIFAHILIALPYMWARSGWALIPSFLAGGFAYATFELGLTNALMQLSQPGEIVQTSSIQSTVIGLRGLVGPFIGVWMAQAGVSTNNIILISAFLIFTSFLLMILLTGKIKGNIPYQLENRK